MLVIMADNFVNVPDNFTKDTDFFKHNPELRYFDCVNKLVKEFGKKKASAYMWAVYLVEDPDSKMYNYKKKRSEVVNNFLKDDEFNWDDIDYLIACYPNISMQPEKRNYKRLQELFEKTIQDVEKEDAKSRIALLKSIKTSLQGLDEAKKRMLEERGEERSRGQIGRSALKQ